MRKKPSIGINLDELIAETRENIKNDRAAANTLLLNIMEIILADPGHTHVSIGFTAGKYLESLQRSSEQMIKLISTLSNKATSSESFSLSSDDKKDVFDELQEELDKELDESKKEEK